MNEGLPAEKVRKTAISNCLALGCRDPLVKAVTKREFHLVDAASAISLSGSCSLAAKLGEFHPEFAFVLPQRSL
jgi:hypothetical protein